MLIDLFATARRFDMEVQPSLVLLQKTLLNIEGLGRQLYPDLDLWQTAQPFLEKWLKDRYSPKNIFNQLKRYAPDWLEHFPQIPPMIFQALKASQPDGPAHKNGDIPESKKVPIKKGIVSGLGYSALGGGVVLGLSQWGEILNEPTDASIALMITGLLILLLR
jgi:ubiquinone biosynthesis protein